MADLTYTTAQVAPVFTIFGKSEIYDGVAGATVEAGQALYIDSSGDLQLTDAGATGTAQFCGIALNGGGAGQAISYLHHGAIYGFDLSGLAYWDLAYLSDADPGDLEDGGAETVVVPVGRVLALPDASRTKVLMIDVDITTANYT